MPGMKTGEDALRERVIIALDLPGRDTAAADPAAAVRAIHDEIA